MSVYGDELLEYDKNLTELSESQHKYFSDLFREGITVRNSSKIKNAFTFAVFLIFSLVGASLNEANAIVLVILLIVGMIVVAGYFKKKIVAKDIEISEQSHELAMAQKQMIAVVLNNHEQINHWDYEMGIESPHLLNNIKQMRLMANKVEYRDDWLYYLANCLTTEVNDKKIEILNISTVGWNSNSDIPINYRGQIYNVKIAGMNVVSPILLAPVSANGFNRVRRHSAELFPYLRGRFDASGEISCAKQLLTPEIQEILSHKFNITNANIRVLFTGDRMVVAESSAASMLAVETPRYNDSIDGFIAQWPAFSDSAEVLKSLSESLNRPLHVASNIANAAKEIEAKL